MKMKIKSLATSISLGLALFLPFMTNATAGLILTLDDGTNSIVINDGDANDLAANSGEIAFFGSLGVWTFNLGGGISDSPLGGLHLTSLNKSMGAGALTITLEDNTFTSPTGSHAKTAIGGVTDGTVEFTSYVNGIEVGHFDPMAGPSFSAETASQVATGSPYTIKMVGKIVHGVEGGTTSFDSNVTVPNPGTVALLGIGLLGLGMSSRRKRRV